jgi:hypothetical protein
MAAALSMFNTYPIVHLPCVLPYFLLRFVLCIHEREASVIV